MRNYEIIRLIHDITREGSGKTGFGNQYLNDIIAIRDLIEEERPEMKEIKDEEHSL